MGLNMNMKIKKSNKTSKLPIESEIELKLSSTAL